MSAKFDTPAKQHSTSCQNIPESYISEPMRFRLDRSPDSSDPERPDVCWSDFYLADRIIIGRSDPGYKG